MVLGQLLCLLLLLLLLPLLLAALLVRLLLLFLAWQPLLGGPLCVGEAGRLFLGLLLLLLFLRE